jgi:hypothetical protein
MKAHLTCISDWFICEEDQKNAHLIIENKPLLPISGTCPLCRTHILWGDMIQQLKTLTRSKYQTSQ